MYWSEWGSNALIERSHMDGANREMVVSIFSYYGGGPNGIALDVNANRLYWLGEHYPAIEYTNLDHLEGVIHTLIPYSSFLFWPHDLTLDDKHIYWVDTYQDVVMRADKATGLNAAPIVTGLWGPRGILTISAKERNPGIILFIILLLLLLYHMSLQTVYFTAKNNKHYARVFGDYPILHLVL